MLSDVRQSAAAGTASRQIWDLLSFSAVQDELRDADTPLLRLGRPLLACINTKPRAVVPALDVLPRTRRRQPPRTLVFGPGRQLANFGRSGRGAAPAAPRSASPTQSPSHLMFVFLRDGRWSRTTAGSRIEKPFVLKWGVFPPGDSRTSTDWHWSASYLTACGILSTSRSAQRCPLSLLRCGRGLSPTPPAKPPLHRWLLHMQVGILYILCTYMYS